MRTSNALLTARGMSKPSALVRWKAQNRRRFSMTGAPATKCNWLLLLVANGQNHMSITSP